MLAENVWSDHRWIETPVLHVAHHTFDPIDNFLAAARLSHRARAIIRQNLAVSLGVVLVMVVATTVGAVPLSIGVAAHEGSTLLVCLNSLRLLFGRAG